MTAATKYKVLRVPADLETTATEPESPSEFQTSAFALPSVVGAVSAFLTDAEPYAAEMIEDLPVSLVKTYAALALRHAVVSEIEPGTWFAAVRGLEGAWGDGDDASEALEELEVAIVGWVAVKRRVGAEIPQIEGLNLNLPPRA